MCFLSNLRQRWSRGHLLFLLFFVAKKHVGTGPLDASRPICRAFGIDGERGSPGVVGIWRGIAYSKNAPLAYCTL